MFNVAIGYDNNKPVLAHTAMQSLVDRSSVPVNVHFINRMNMPFWKRPRGEFDSTEFSNSRFLVPYLYNYTGWTLYVDNDVIFLEDVAELFDLRDDRYAVMCVKHNQKVTADKKFLGITQTKYQYKNWSSVMLFNNARCRALSLDYVTEAPGLDLHQFKWTDIRDIGELPLSWNYLVENENQTDEPPKLLHYTNGAPCYRETQSCDYSKEWHETWNDMARR